MEEVLDNAVQMRIDVHTTFIGRGDEPSYRLYVNDELFSERTYRYESGTYLTEQLFVNKNPGAYKVRIESLGSFKYKLRNLRCAYGTADIIDNETFRI